MIKLKTLKFKNVGRFTSEQFIDFTSLDNLVQVDAINNNTGGSSGSGKSTIFYMILWILGLDTLPTTVLQSRLTDEHISGTIELDWDGKHVVVKRARKLSVTIEGQDEVTGSSKLAEEELDKVFGLKRSLFKVLLLKAQGDQGFFLNMGPSKIFEFLTDCLSLGSIRSKIDVIDVKLKGLGEAKTTSESDLTSSKAALEATKSAQVSLGQEPVASTTTAVVDGWKAQLDEAQATLQALLGSNQLEKDALQATKPKLVIVPYDRTQIDALETEIKSLESQINTELDKERSRQVEVNNVINDIKSQANNKIAAIRLDHGNKIAEAKTTLFNLNNIVQKGALSKNCAVQYAGQLQTLRDGSCHTCLQPWISEHKKLEEERLLKQLSECKTDMEAASIASQEIEKLKSTLVLLNECVNADIAGLTSKMNADTAVLVEQAKPQISPEFTALKEKTLDLAKQKTAEFLKEDAHKTEQNQKNQKLLESFFLDQKALADKHQKLVDSVSKEVAENKSQYEQSAQALGAHLIALNRYKESHNSLSKKCDEAVFKVAGFAQKVDELKEKLEIAEEAKRCLKSYLSCSFDDALDSISNSATQLLRSVPTMANASIRLEGTKETGSGAIKECVNAAIDNDGELGIPIKSLSGGERSAVDLAIDLAVCEMIQDRANKGIDIMILDEPFNGFDSTGIEHALEILRVFSKDKKILFVEHDSVAKEMVTSKITVVRDGETSTIK